MNSDELRVVLQLLNQVRKGCGLKPLSGIPKGGRPDSGSDLGSLCPLARAIPETVIAAEYARTTNRQTAEAMARAFGEAIQTWIEFPQQLIVDLPALLAEFVAHYDREELPQFVLSS